MADTFDDAHLVLDEYHAQSGLTRAGCQDVLHELVRLLVGHARRGFVEQQQLGLADERTAHLDTPPVEPVVDGLYLARHADVIVFIVRWAVTPQASAKHAVAALRESAPEGTPILAVLNQQERTKLFGYQTYSDYYVN